MASATLLCPQCGASQSVDVPADSCLALHRCTACGALLTPKAGDCCVVCSYSPERCPVSVKTT